MLRFPDDIHYELIFVFGAVGIIISFLVNNWIVRRWNHWTGSRPR
ncbi:MAG: hypothetical protein R2851_20615 [Caldilineaceae bacterium]